LPDPVDERVEEGRPEGERLLGAAVHGLAERVDVHARLRYLLRVPGDPELPELRRRLRMELDAPRVDAVETEGLVRIALARREEPGAGRRVEHVVVPLVDRRVAVEDAEDGIVLRLLGRADLQPAD